MTGQACNDTPAQALKTIAKLGHHTQQKPDHSIGEGRQIENDLHFETQEWIWVVGDAKCGEE